MSVALSVHLELFKPWFDDPTVEGISINKPGELFISRSGDFKRVECKEIDAQLLATIAQLVANETPDCKWPTDPMLSAELPGGQRVQFFGEPACQPGPIALSIRCPRFRPFTLAELGSLGAFERKGMTVGDVSPLSRATIELLFPEEHGPKVRRRSDNRAAPHPIIESALENGTIESLLEALVLAKRNIVVVGSTNSGKTSITNALLRCVPHSERIITIENVREIRLEQANVLHLFGVGDRKASEYLYTERVLAGVLRAEPNRILLGELRDSEAYTFLQAINTGHPGSITTVHADSVEGAMLRIAEMAAPGAPHLNAEHLRALVAQFVHVFIHVRQEKTPTGTQRIVEEIAFV